MSGPLFPSLVSGSRGPSSRHLVEFRAGKMMQKGGSTVYPDKRKGLVYVQHSEDSLIHFCWKDRNTGDVEDDLIIFPDDCEFKRVNKCTTGRVYVLKFKTGPKRLFFWMQEPKVDRDEEHCRKVNEYIHNPPGAPGGGAGSHELSALGGEGVLQNFLENMDANQLMQLISTGQGGLSALGALAGPGGLASLLGSGGPAAGNSSSSSSSSSRSASEAASQSSGVTPWLSAQTSTSPPAAPTASSTGSPAGGGLTPSPPAAFPFAQTPNQPIQLSDLQNILATMNNNGGYAPAAAAAGAQGPSGVDLASVCTPEMMAPILCSAEVQQILLPLLPSGESLPQSPEEISDTSTPQFQQAMSLFAVALASGQLGPLLGQFGLPPEAVDAANRGDLDAFANAVENSNKGGPSKDKKDDDEDNMSLD